MLFLRLLCVFFLLIVVIPCTWSAPELRLDNPYDLPINEDQLKKDFAEAYHLFSKEIGNVDGPISITIASPGCLRTAYNFVQKKIVFCDIQKVNFMGLHSTDVVHHEIFHALLCHHSPHLCEGDLRVDLHEGLADYFAYKLHPDLYFGEDFYVKSPYIRRYLTSWRVGLVQKDHERGNAYVSEFIRSGFTLEEGLRLFDEDRPLDELRVAVAGTEESSLRRYRMGPKDTITFTFSFSPKSHVTHVRWVLPQEFILTKVSWNQFQLQLTKVIPNTRGYVLFLGPNGEEKGRSIYYFGNKIE